MAERWHVQSINDDNVIDLAPDWQPDERMQEDAISAELAKEIAKQENWEK